MIARLRHLTTVELALRWNVSTRTLEGWRGRGLGPRFVRFGRVVRYPLAEIESHEASALVPADRGRPA